MCVSHLSPLHATAFSVQSFRNKHCSCTFVSDSPAPWMEKEWEKGGAVIWGLIAKHFSHLAIERACSSWEGSMHCSSHWAAIGSEQTCPPVWGDGSTASILYTLCDILGCTVSPSDPVCLSLAQLGCPVYQCVSPRAGVNTCISSGRVWCLVEGGPNQSFVADSK